MVNLGEGYSNSNGDVFGNLKPMMQPELDISDDRISNIQPAEMENSSTQWVLIGGTVLVLAAAFALGVSMTTELGINMEWR
jgi:hypothetical protein